MSTTETHSNEETPQPKKRTFWGTLLWLLQLRDGIWSIPAIFFIFWLSGNILTYFFGWGTGAYDPAFIQPLFLAGLIVVGAMNFGLFVLYFNFRTLHRYIYGSRSPKKHKALQNICSPEDFKNLTAWQRILLSTCVLFLPVVLVVLVYIKLV